MAPAPLEPRIATVRRWLAASPRSGPPLGVPVGGTLGDLRVTGHLARGRTTELYQVWSPRHLCLLTAKVLAPEHAENPRALSAFRREERTMRSQRHPGVVRWFGSGKAAGRAYLLQEFLAGPSLRELLDASPERRLRPNDAIRVVLGVGSAVHALHGSGYLYRDVKPANVLFREAQPVLVDFDATRRLRGGRPADREGTAPYMAPEQVLREPLSPASDVYGLGVLLYEMVAGRWPTEEPDPDEAWYDDDTSDGPSAAMRPAPAGQGSAPAKRPSVAELQGRYPQLTSDPVPFRRQGVRVRAALTEIVLRALARDPAERYTTIPEMLEPLAGLLRGRDRMWP